MQLLTEVFQRNSDWEGTNRSVVLPRPQDSAVCASMEDVPLYVSLDPGAVTPNNRLDDPLVIARWWQMGMAWVRGGV